MTDYRELTVELTKLVHDLNPNMPMVVVGAAYPSDIEEFIKFNVLLGEPWTSRTHHIEENLFIEVSCYSKHAHYRTDRDIYRPWSLAKPYGELFHQKRIRIKNTCISFKEARQIYLDLNSLGDFANNIQQQSPKLNLHAVIIECRGTINQSRE